MEQGGATRSAEGRRAVAVAVAASWFARARWRLAQFGAFLRDSLERELAERAGFHWLAIAFGTGSLIYFTLPREPLFAALCSAAALAAAIAVVSYRRGTAWRLAAIVAACLIGATAAKLRVDNLGSPRIERAMSVQISGRVVDREARIERRPRIVLDGVATDRASAASLPGLVRLTLAEKYELPPLGGHIALRARLMPVADPVVPGGYDARRAAFFQGVGASGFALGGWQETKPAATFSSDLAIANVRAAIVARIMASVPGEDGAVASALLVGERSGLSAETNESLRRSGLAHILSISGLHMMLIAGTAFFLVRAALALSPRLALSRPIRKWSAVAALIVVTAYFALSGGDAATVRSYVMAAIMFAAILLDRPAISMRNLAIAAFVVVAVEPEGVTEPGFQMSFAAVAALIAGWEVWRDRPRRRLADDDVVPGWRVVRYVGRAIAGVAVTTLIAGLATAPFAAYHFERIAPYSLLGNLLAAPLVSAIIMPFGLLALVVMPFGLESLPLAVMAWGIRMLLWVSGLVASLPGSDMSAPRMAPVTLALISAGMVWLCIWRLRWRLLGLPAVAVGLVLIPVLSDPPDILVAPDGKAVAVRDATGVLRVSGARAGSYAVEQFFDEELGPDPDTAALREGVRCDRLACELTGAGGLAVAHVLDPAAFPEDCRRADVIATPLVAPADCGAALVIDAKRLARFGAHAVRLGADGSRSGFAIATERSAFPRPWQAGVAAEISTSASAR